MSDGGAVEINIHLGRPKAYAFTCCGRRVSRRALRWIFFVAVGVAVVTLVTFRAVRRGGSVWAILLDVALALVALLTPIPVR